MAWLIKRVNGFLIAYKNNKLGITIRAVKTKNNAQLPSSQSTMIPEYEPSITRPNVPNEAISAYWLAVKLLLHKTDSNATKATEPHAEVKPSTNTVNANSILSGPTIAISANNKLLEAMAIPPINKPFKIP